MQEVKIANYISQWLKEYSIKSKTKGFVVGISGGVDSALTSTLCARTKLPLICVEMPIYQKKYQVSLATSHIHWLKKTFSNVYTVSIPLTNAFESLKKVLPNVSEENSKLALANTRSRLRMVSLYYIASIHNYLVVGTGNKIEDFGIGFYTKYGDGGVDLSPIADLIKSEVYQISKKIGVSQDILNTPPTDGLWDDDRTDENQIGATYLELEWAINRIKKRNGEESKDEKFLTEREKEVMKIYTKLHKSNKHKMGKIPICVIPKELK